MPAVAKGSAGSRALLGFLLSGRMTGELEPYFFGEFQVALVVGGDAHDRAGAVVHEDVVGDPDGHLLPVVRIDRVVAGEEALLLDQADVSRLARFFLVGEHLFEPASLAASLPISSATSGCCGASCTEVAP